MPVSQMHHPDLDKLTAFGLGLLSEAHSAEIELHLSDCDACCQKLEYLPADSLVDLLQASEADTPSDLSASCHTIESRKIPSELAGHLRYEVLEPLGAGGMGAVYKAKHRLMDRIVALKIVNPVLVTKPGAVERFIREVKAAAQLTHPNIVTAYDAEQVGDMHVLVMEYVEGDTLAELLQEQGVLGVTQACDYVRQTALGLQHAVDCGMVHRDIKPLNLMLTKQRAVKILDFGLARFVSEQRPLEGSTEQGSMMGSPDYMAPEQARDAHTADARADIYSLGCTLYQLLAGQVPFPGLPLLEKLEAHRDQQPPALNQIRIDVPADLERIIAKMMAKTPDQRYQTPAEVAEALLPFTQARRTHAPLDAKPSKPAVERICFSKSDKPARLLVQNNVANHRLEFHNSPGSLTVQNNWITSPHEGVKFYQRVGSVLIRNNVVDASEGIVVEGIPLDNALSATGIDLRILNNVLEAVKETIVFLNESKATCVLPRSAWIANNIHRSRGNFGILMIPEDMQLVKDRWNIGPNVYQAEPTKAPWASYVSWPIGPRDLTLPKHFLSVEPNNADYFRIAADGPLATGGAGGDLPTYFGAFPPGPAPKDGDWFTRMHERK